MIIESGMGCWGPVVLVLILEVFLVFVKVLLIVENFRKSGRKKARCHLSGGSELHRGRCWSRFSALPVHYKGRGYFPHLSLVALGARSGESSGFWSHALGIVRTDVISCLRSRPVEDFSKKYHVLGVGNAFT